MGLHRILQGPPPFSIPRRHSGKEEANAKKSVSRCVKKADAKMKVIVNTRFVVEIHSRCWCLWRQSPSNNSNLSPRWPGQWLFCRGCRPKRGKWEKDNERGGERKRWQLEINDVKEITHAGDDSRFIPFSKKKGKASDAEALVRTLMRPCPAHQGQRG